METNISGPVACRIMVYHGFNEMFHSVNNGVAYATAMLYSDKEQIVQVLYGGSGETLFIVTGK